LLVIQPSNPGIELIVISEEYRTWNAKLFDHFFGSFAAYRPVYLDVDEDVLGALGGEASDPVASLISAIRPSLVSNGTITFTRHQTALRRWRAEGRTSPPPFIALLGVFVLAANRMRASGDFRANNYYIRLAELLASSMDEQGRLRSRLSALGHESSALWDELNSWMEAEGGRRGLPTARPFSSNIHVSRHISQALLRQHDHEALFSLFAEAGLEPGSSPRPSEMRDMLENWRLANRLSRGLTALLTDGGAAEPLTSAALDLLLEWDGEDPRADRPRPVSANQQPWRLLVRSRHRPARPPALEAKFIGRDHSGLSGPVRITSGQEAIDRELTRSATPGWVEIDHSVPIDAIPAQVEIRPTAGHAFTWSAPSVLLLRYDADELFGFVETSRTVAGERYLVLHLAGTPDTHEELGQLPPQPSNTAGRWNVHRDVEAPLEGSGPAIRFEGGTRLMGHSTFHVSAPPTILVFNAPVESQLIVEHASSRGRIHREFPLGGEAMERLRVAEQDADRGQYVVRLLATAEADGSGLRVVSQASFRLVQAAGAPGASAVFPGYDLEADFTPGRLSELPAEPAIPFIRGAEAVARAALAKRPDGEYISPCESGQRRWWKVNRLLKYPTRPISETLDDLRCPECGRPFKVAQHFRSSNTLIRVWGSCNPSVAVQVTSWRREADAEDEVSEPAEAGAALLDYARLLDGMSLLRSGDMLRARKLLGESGHEPGALIGTNSCLLFESLGHIEVERDPLHFKPTAWHIAPPRLARIVGSNWALCGYRSQELVETLERRGAQLGVEVLHREFGGIPVIMVMASSELALQILVDGVNADMELGLTVTTGLASSKLLGALPGTDELVESLPPALTPSLEAPRWNPVNGHWAATDHDHPLARVSEMPSLYTLDTPLGARHVDVRLGKYLAARMEGLTLLRYNHASSTLTVPTGTELPSLYERVAVLSSGLPPVQEYEWTRYRFVPKVLASRLAAKLGMTLEEDDPE